MMRMRILEFADGGVRHETDEVRREDRPPVPTGFRTLALSRPQVSVLLVLVARAHRVTDELHDALRLTALLVGR